MRRILHRLVLRPAMRRLTGIDVHHSERLPRRGPAIVVANHNSHIDTALLLASFPGDTVGALRPAAAADYWFRNRIMAWFSRHVLGAVPIVRSGGGADPLAAVSGALGRGDIVIMFPEGTRGEPGRMGRFRSGVARLAAQHPEAEVVPVWLSGCDQVLPRHGRWPQRRHCSVRVGEPAAISSLAPDAGVRVLEDRVAALA